MRFRIYLSLFGISLLVILISSAYIQVPGYMDAEYYYVGGMQLASGAGFSEPFIWNYLDNPMGVPHPSHTYWMPLTSLIAAAGMMLTGRMNFDSARLFLVLFSAGISPLTTYMCWKITKDRFQAILAGVFACLPGFYLIYLGDTDSFTMSMILGSGFLLLLGIGRMKRKVEWMCLGLLAGLLHLNRADGLLWIALGCLFVIWSSWRERLRIGIVWRFSLLLAGYLVVMAPWYIRNIQLFQSLFSPAGGRMFFLPTYDALFTYPAELITIDNYLKMGLGPLVQLRLDSLGANLQSLVAVQGGVLLFPFILFGVWHLRNSEIVRWGMLAWLGTWIIMTVVFPQAGQRGGYFHSSAAFQPLLWSTASAGFVEVIRFCVLKIKHWKLERARIGFTLVLGIACLFFSVIVFSSTIGGGDPEKAWDHSFQKYKKVGEVLDEMGINSQELFLVNNPPGFFLATGRLSIVIPYPGKDALFAAASHFKARYLILEKDTVEGLRGLYAAPTAIQGISYVRSIEGVQVFKLSGVR